MLLPYHSLLPDNRHAVFHSIDTIRNLPEVILAQGFLVCIECAVVSACRLKVSPGGGGGSARNTQKLKVILLLKIETHFASRFMR